MPCRHDSPCPHHQVPCFIIAGLAFHLGEE
jgi:hypothetical protein